MTRMMKEEETIVALATPPGEGAIAVIRLSGSRAIEIADAVFRGRSRLSGAPGYTAHHGSVVRGAGERVDEVIATVFHAPHSYTGEDAVEISCHGGMLVSGRVLRVLLDAGARQAGPGEFTRRAFMHGRMDLSQAEAVADLIRARSERARSLSLQQLEGRLGGRVAALRRELTRLCALLEVELDFSEEGIDFVTRDELRKNVEAVLAEVKGMRSSFTGGKIAREGVSVVLTGRPNAGKSSLFNALLQEERAIVTPVAGTTRDFLEESIALSGLLFRLHDTAGLREATDLVEAAGIERSRRVVERSDIVVEVVDASDVEVVLHALGRPVDQGNLDGQDAQVRQRGSAVPTPAQSGSDVVVLNKVDLLDREKRERLEDLVGGSGQRMILGSAQTGEGVSSLKEALVELATGGNVTEEGVVVTNERHVEALGRAAASMEQALRSVGEGATSEFVAFDLREAANALAEITGEITREDILNHIFAQFCVGK